MSATWTYDTWTDFASMMQPSLTTEDQANLQLRRVANLAWLARDRGYRLRLDTHVTRGYRYQATNGTHGLDGPWSPDEQTALIALLEALAPLL